MVQRVVKRNFMLILLQFHSRQINDFKCCKCVCSLESEAYSAQTQALHCASDFWFKLIETKNIKTINVWITSNAPVYWNFFESNLLPGCISLCAGIGTGYVLNGPNGWGSYPNKRIFEMRFLLLILFFFIIHYLKSAMSRTTQFFLYYDTVITCFFFFASSPFSFVIIPNVNVVLYCACQSPFSETDSCQVPIVVQITCRPRD